jgi:hypothetical protein
VYIYIYIIYHLCIFYLFNEIYFLIIKQRTGWSIISLFRIAVKCQESDGWLT